MLDANTYAQALFSSHKGTPATVVQWLDTLASLSQDKKQALQAVDPTVLPPMFAKSGAPQVIHELVSTLLQNNDVALLPRIAAAFRRLLHRQHISVIDVRLATHNQETLNHIQDHFGHQAVLIEHIDPAVIAGLSISTHQTTHEYSIRNKLDQVRTVLAGR